MLTHSDPRKGTLPNFESVDSQNWVGDKDPFFRDGANPFLNMVVHVIGYFQPFQNNSTVHPTSGIDLPTCHIGRY